jgi:hypothetical protein
LGDDFQNEKEKKKPKKGQEEEDDEEEDDDLIDELGMNNGKEVKFSDDDLSEDGKAFADVSNL